MGRRVLIDPRVGRKYQCMVAGFVLCLVFACLSAILLTGLGATIVRWRAYAADFLPTTCTGAGEERLGNEDCSCGRGCRAWYPCVKVFVNYQTDAGLAVSKATIYSYQDDLFDSSGCSIKKCDKSFAVNNATVMKFVSEYSSGKNPCFYNPTAHSEALASRETNILHLVLWPSLAVVVFGVATAALIPGCVRAVKRSKQIRAADKGHPPQPSALQQGATNTSYTAGSDSVTLGGQPQPPPAHVAPATYWEPPSQHRN